ncbi:MAG: hypothetical protein M1378_08140 [Bacteroidetes bacterium]|nr:hypothetical protein [Bacteroidota bacterium]
MRRGRDSFGRNDSLAVSVIPSEYDTNGFVADESKDLVWIHSNAESEETPVKFLRSLVATWP